MLYVKVNNSDWPLYSNRGEYFVYYHAFVLLPALFASLFSSVPPWILIAMWVWLGLVLAFCCLAMRYRRRTMIFLVLLMVLGTPAAIFQLDHHFLANYWPIKDVVALYRHFLPVPLSYPGMWNQCADTYNHGIIALLFLSMMHGKLLKGKDVVLASGLVVACSPIAAPGILFLIFLSVPLASYKKVICDLLKMPLFYAELVLLSLLFTYYTSASNSTCSLGWNVFGGEFYGVYLASVCSFLLPLVVFGWKYRHTRSFVTIFILAVVLPVVWVGKLNNELLFKNCVLLYFILTAYAVGARSYVHRFKKLVCIFVLALCSYSFLYVVRLAVRDFEIVPVLREHNRHNEWQGSLNHPEHYMYSQFWGMHPGFPFKQ